jgi:hypothetical protein
MSVSSCTSPGGTIVRGRVLGRSDGAALRDAQVVGGIMDGASMKVAGDGWRCKYVAPAGDGRRLLQCYEVRGDRIVYLHSEDPETGAIVR